MGYLERIRDWKACISSAFREAPTASSLDSFEKQNANLFAETTDIGVDLEISFREVLAGVLESSCGSNEVVTENSEEFKLLKFAFAFAVRFHSMSSLQIPKLPFVMLEDIMECQTIEKAEAIWQIVEALTDTITHPDIFSKGKLTVLRMCNSLLRKLSKSCNTEFCGRVLMFLAAIYPLSEKSALNLSGKVNTNNVTYFEEEAAYYSNAGCPAPKGVTEEGDAGAVEEEKGEGESGNEMEVEEEAGAVPEMAYDLYRAFWKLQAFFASDQKSVDSADAWRDFMQHARTVVQLFEDSDFTDAELAQARSHANIAVTTGLSGLGGAIGAADGHAVTAAGAAQGGEQQARAYSGCKYLTSSQLFSLQLRDPTVRQQVAVQILYFIHYIRTKTNPYAPTELVAEVSKDMLFLHDRAYRLIERSPHDGARLVAVLKRLLAREARFVAWKTLSCPEIEISRPVLSEEELSKRAAFNLHKDSSLSFALYKRRPQRVKVKRSAESAAQSALLAGYQFDHSDAHVKTVARELVKSIPSYEEEIQQYVDAEDPDAGIEEEYHPKKNNLYCWRARRLMAAQHLHAFEAMGDGDIGKGLRKLSNQPEPVEGAEGAESGEGASSAADADVGADAEVDAEVEAAMVADATEEAEGVLAEEGLAGLQDARDDAGGTEVKAVETKPSVRSGRAEDSRKRKLAPTKPEVAEDGEEVE